MLFYLTPAIQPRMLVTFDEDLNPLQVTVRVGQVREVAAGQTVMSVHVGGKPMCSDVTVGCGETVIGVNR